MPAIILYIVLIWAIIVVAYYVLVYSYLIIAFMLTGMFGFYIIMLIKIKYPLIDRKWPWHVVIAYAFMWAFVIVFGLIVGSFIQHELLYNNGFVEAHELAWWRTIAINSVICFFETCIMLLNAALLSRSTLAKTNINFTIAISCAVSSVVLFPQEWLLLNTIERKAIMHVIFAQLWHTIIFSYNIIVDLHNGGHAILDEFIFSIRNSKGNMFILIPYLSKVLFIISIIKFMLGIFRKTHNKIIQDNFMSDENVDTQLLFRTVFLMFYLIISICISIYSVLHYHSADLIKAFIVVSSTFVFIPIFYIRLIVALWRSMPRHEKHPSQQ